MIDPSDDFFATLLSDMGELIQTRQADLSPAELDRAIASIATVAATCGRAVAYCHRMNFDDTQTQSFMRAVLQGLVANARQASGATPGKAH